MNEMENKTAKVIAESIESKRERKKKQKEVISVERYDRNNAMKNSHCQYWLSSGYAIVHTHVSSSSSICM